MTLSAQGVGHVAVLARSPVLTALHRDSVPFDPYSAMPGTCRNGSTEIHSSSS